jgi:hypothetical protein
MYLHTWHAENILKPTPLYFHSEVPGRSFYEDVLASDYWIPFWQCMYCSNGFKWPRMKKELAF